MSSTEDEIGSEEEEGIASDGEEQEEQGSAPTHTAASGISLYNLEINFYVNKLELLYSNMILWCLLGPRSGPPEGKKVCRGPTVGKKLHRARAKGEPKTQVFFDEIGVPRKNRKDLVNNIGMTVRANVPLTIKNWRKDVKESTLEKIWDECKV